MSSNKFVKKYSFTASLGFLAGLVFCMTGLLFAMVSRLSRSSGSEIILVVCFLMGAGILLILAGISIAGIRQQLLRSYSFITGMLLSSTGLLIFILSFPDKWFYPKVSYVIIFYSAGIFLLLINIFVNYFLQASEVPEGTGIMASKQQSANLKNEPEQHNDCSVLTTFAGILITNITSGAMSGSYESSFLTNTSCNDDNFIITNTVSEELDPEPFKMEITEENTVLDTVVTDDTIESNPVIGGSNESTVLETRQFPEIIDILEAEEIGIPEDEEGSDEDMVSKADVPQQGAEIPDSAIANIIAAIPFSEFISMKKTDIKADDTMREAARKILMFQFGAMIEHERGTKVGKDIEELHDMRVAAMRMRSAVEVLEGYIDMKAMSPYFKDMRSTRKVLGSVRDLDVFLEKINTYLADQPPEKVQEMDPLEDSLLIERAKNRGNMLVYLDDVRYNKFKNNFADYLLHKKSWKMKSVKKNGEPVASRVIDVLPVLLYTQFAVVRSYDEVVSSDTAIDPSLEKYHLLRIDVKILRYTLEFFNEVLGPQSKGLVKDLKALQDNLGDMHDTVVALKLLDNFEKYGRWGETNEKKLPASSGFHDYPGVDAYIEFRKKELQKLLESFPDVWSKVLDSDFSVRFSQAISGIYTS
ncbi:CHAD domain-containing protein [Methanolobus psychrotolerans]|uniref:CHAD domain-containing protein n=1 Tax=Methanolobus psychrotolerans TaxID=1874706 RepID=UPI00101ADB8F|nr:CHAD domain-containing protein [Methanolobus psychrotolerans]